MLVRDVGEHMQVAAREKGVELAVDLPASCHVGGDVDRLRQLFFNLLDNAIKYTPPGGKVTVRGGPVEWSDPRHGRRHGDRNPGRALAPCLRPLLSRRSLPEPRDRRVGLGLAICRSIAEAHGGRVEIDSTFGSGH